MGASLGELYRVTRKLYRKLKINIRSETFQPTMVCVYIHIKQPPIKFIFRIEFASLLSVCVNGDIWEIMLCRQRIKLNTFNSKIIKFYYQQHEGMHFKLPFSCIKLVTPDPGDPCIIVPEDLNKTYPDCCARFKCN